MSSKNERTERLYHPFPPVWDGNSRFLILGSFPSVTSRRESFYYAHPQNRFWKMLALIYSEELDGDNDSRVSFLHKKNIAVWDVIASCCLSASSDASIKNAEVNDLTPIFQGADIRKVLINGAAAYSLYERHCRVLYESFGAQVIKMPSTSPANATKKMADLIREWGRQLRIE